MTTRHGGPAPDRPTPGEALFGRTAADYSRYRPGVPDAALRLLAATLHGVPAPVLLDLGTGTAQVPCALLPVVPRLAHVDLVDVNQGMLDQAMAELKAVLGTCTASAYVGEAQTFTPRASGRGPDLITCCRAFHWMNRPAVLSMADRVTAPHTVLAIMGDGSLWTDGSDWTSALRALIQTYLGETRRAGALGTYAEPGRSYQDDLAASPFSNVTERRFPVARTWTPEKVVGYLRTTSFAQPSLFTDRHPRFEAEALELLKGYAGSGALKEEAVFSVLLARRPGAPS